MSFDRHSPVDYAIGYSEGGRDAARLFFTLGFCAGVLATIILVAVF